MLDKYDEEEEDAGMEIDASGAVNDEKARKQAEIRAKLAAGGFPACICCVRFTECVLQLQFAWGSCTRRRWSMCQMDILCSCLRLDVNSAFELVCVSMPVVVVLSFCSCMSHA